ncbi:mitochondrial 54S ribosomal protein uL6m [Calcarisporiella thermophila]|uniref:mitochondrial 54S ribosomal protein uL6m n=1 Tax=Calcarisporiella thermophila TaxID=911321 RepID=UPI0037432C3F
MALHLRQFFRLPTSARPFSTTPFTQSHIGRRVISYPSEVRILHDPTPLLNPSAQGLRNCTQLHIEGPLGKHTVPIKPFVQLAFGDECGEESGSNKLQVRVQDPSIKEQRAMWGTTRALIHNSVVGVTQGHRVALRLVGVGYRATMEGANKISLKLGYAHPIELPVPEGVTCTVPQPNRIVLQGVDLQQVKEFAARIRRWRPPEPYNQKGIFVGDETIKKKEGKKK